MLAPVSLFSLYICWRNSGPCASWSCNNMQYRKYTAELRYLLRISN